MSKCAIIPRAVTIDRAREIVTEKKKRSAALATAVREGTLARAELERQYCTLVYGDIGNSCG